MINTLSLNSSIKSKLSYLYQLSLTISFSSSKKLFLKDITQH